MTAENSSTTQEQFAKFQKEEAPCRERQEKDLCEMKERIIVIETQLAKHGGTLFGNGKIGMDEHIRNIWAWVAEQKEKAKRETIEKIEDERERRRARLNLQNSLILLFISQIITIVVSIWFKR